MSDNNYKELYLNERIRSLQFEREYLQVRFAQIQREIQDVSEELTTYKSNKETAAIIEKDTE